MFVRLDNILTIFVLCSVSDSPIRTYSIFFSLADNWTLTRCPRDSRRRAALLPGRIIHPWRWEMDGLLEWASLASTNCQCFSSTFLSANETDSALIFLASKNHTCCFLEKVFSSLQMLCSTCDPAHLWRCTFGAVMFSYTASTSLIKSMPP